MLSKINEHDVHIRVYVDVVVNHMTGMGMHGVGDGGSFFDSGKFDFPGVPYRAEHFTPRSECPNGKNQIRLLHSFFPLLHSYQ